MVGSQSTVRAWRPALPGVAEVFHAHFVDHAYPMHTHDSWDLMILDQGAVGFSLDRYEHGSADRGRVILLPPGVPHDGRTVNNVGFRKRVLYLNTTVLPPDLIGAAVDSPLHDDHMLRDRLSALHDCLTRGQQEQQDLEAESRLAFVRERLLGRLQPAARRSHQPSEQSSRRMADALRQLIDSRFATGLTLAEAGDMLGASPAHLVRTFSQTFGLPPHRYLTSRRIDHARGLLLLGVPVADAATAAGFHDQSHLHRHFKKFLGTTPGAYRAQTT